MLSLVNPDRFFSPPFLDKHRCLVQHVLLFCCSIPQAHVERPPSPDSGSFHQGESTSTQWLLGWTTSYGWLRRHYSIFLCGRSRYDQLTTNAFSLYPTEQFKFKYSQTERNIFLFLLQKQINTWIHVISVWYSRTTCAHFNVSVLIFFFLTNGFLYKLVL